MIVGIVLDLVWLIVQAKVFILKCRITGRHKLRQFTLLWIPRF